MKLTLMRCPCCKKRNMHYSKAVCSKCSVIGAGSKKQREQALEEALLQEAVRAARVEVYRRQFEENGRLDYCDPRLLQIDSRIEAIYEELKSEKSAIRECRNTGLSDQPEPGSGKQELQE